MMDGISVIGGVIDRRYLEGQPIPPTNSTYSTSVASTDGATCT
jgi:hypothetical protein